MKKAVSFLCAILIASTGTVSYAASEPSGGLIQRVRVEAISRVPPPMNLSGKPLTVFPEQLESGCYDVRMEDLSRLDLTKDLDKLLLCSFDDQTKWPEKLPEGFDPDTILEQAKDPGLGLRELHTQGITGKGVGIGVIDQTLLTGHQEYKDRLRYYREYGNMRKRNAQMHGAAVVSIAAGETTGVAPDALLYYIADDPMRPDKHGEMVYDVTSRAERIDQFIELNKTLPEDEKIRVISYSNGWLPDTPGAKEIEAAVARAKDAGILFMCISDTDPLRSQFFGMGREPLASPNDLSATKPATWNKSLYEGMDQSEYLLVPMDFTTTAAPTDNQDYVYYAEGGMSWVMPYLAGLYALAYQVRPGVTLEEFVEAARATAHPVSVKYEGKDLPYGSVIDPGAIIQYLTSIN